ncbi:hypothetical protein V6N11_042256 [Hibiscus sabdariffa]|uniref:Uncharacterized protein n=1 Tax=Hibiscus sabdariffa TaxID=183260 RepID=A0ABR2QVS5_9ROSI
MLRTNFDDPQKRPMISQQHTQIQKSKLQTQSGLICFGKEAADEAASGHDWKNLVAVVAGLEVVVADAATKEAIIALAAAA